MAAPRRAATAAILVIASLIAIAIVGPVVTADPLRGDLDAGVSAIGAPLPPSGSAPLGTDALGRDELARVVAGAGSSLAIAALATAIAMAIGLAVGVAAGYAGGRVDGALMRSVDLVLAFPFLLLAILLAALMRARGSGEVGGTAVVVVTLGVASWPAVARVIRAKTAILARGDMVTAARALGASPWRIAVRHLAPNVATAAVALGALLFAQTLLAEAALSYVGLGPPPPAASWGRMIYEARAYYRTAPWLIAAPGVAIVVAVLAFAALAHALEERA
jgi:ABC-type dipeptide/oligopeptide/nickel transport system permease subunit|nr:ABC transporter permease [Kofleriaceae bacterium]